MSQWKRQRSEKREMHSSVKLSDPEDREIDREFGYLSRSH